ncbi:MAG: glycosyl transferase family 1 [Candidatus Rokuibacteriota bacterium]|nr:MAG: glycosyl transferase family 1 [Candidatus Rokubacteria bacterium]
MKIVQLSKNDRSGGAARAAYRLHQGLQLVGQHSVMVVESRTSDDPSVVTFEKPMDGLELVRRGLRQVRIAQDANRYRRSRPKGYEEFSDDRSAYASAVLDQIPACDVINLHWIPGFVDYRTFFKRMTRSTPIVWTLHDLNPLTGGCHYSLGCDRYLAHCGTCPQLGSDKPKDLSHEIWERKRRVFSRAPPSTLHFVAPSRWLGGEMRRSPILGRFGVDVIPYGLDVEEFAPRHRGSVRDLLGIPRDARVLLFVAEEVGNERKGFTCLVKALAQCAGKIPNLMLLSVGRNRPAVPIDIPWRHLGSVDNDRFLSMVYSAADLFAICSLQDNLPNTVLEAIACGIPVVGHAVGGIPDMIRNGVNGLTVPVADVEALGAAIADVLRDTARCAEMGANARRIAVEEYSLELQGRRYSELYATLVEPGGPYRDGHLQQE